jgi:hypothetical protein
VQNPQAENVQRWLAWRIACESGRDRAEAYDVYLHPRSRVAVERILAEYGREEGFAGAVRTPG